jgi:hypothetical protein
MIDIKMKVVNSTCGLGDTEYSLCDGAGLLKFDKPAMDECCEMINNHDNLVEQVKDLEFSLDDRDCYIADADMKNEALTKQVAELRAALGCVVGNTFHKNSTGIFLEISQDDADKAIKALKEDKR